MMLDFLISRAAEARHELCRGLHAEQNAIIQAARHGVNIENSVLYCTDSPCIICTKMLINAGIQKVVYLQGYADKLSMEMLEESGIEACLFDKVASGGS